MFICFFLFLSFILNAEELNGFFGFNLGDSLGKLRNDEIFEEMYGPSLHISKISQFATEEEKLLEALGCEKYSLSLCTLRHTDKSKTVKLTSNTKYKSNTKRKLYLEDKESIDRNDKILRLRERFKYGGLEVLGINFIYFENTLVGLILNFDYTKDVRDSENIGYIYEDESVGFTKLSESRLAGFSLLRDAVAEKYSLELKKKEKKQFVPSWFDMRFHYSSKDDLKRLIFEYRDGKQGIFNENVQLFDKQFLISALSKKIVNEVEKETEKKKSLMDEL